MSYKSISYVSILYVFGNSLLGLHGFTWVYPMFLKIYRLWIDPWKYCIQQGFDVSYPETDVIPSGKSPCSMGKSTISMAMFNSFFYVYQRLPAGPGRMLDLKDASLPVSSGSSDRWVRGSWNLYMSFALNNHEDCANQFVCDISWR